MQCKAKQSKAKQSNAQQSKAKQSNKAIQSNVRTPKQSRHSSETEHAHSETEHAHSETEQALPSETELARGAATVAFYNIIKPAAWI